MLQAQATTRSWIRLRRTMCYMGTDLHLADVEADADLSHLPGLA